MAQAQGDSKKAQNAIKLAQTEILQYKERNRRLEGDAGEARGEIEKAREAVRAKDEQLKEAKNAVSFTNIVRKSC